MLEINSNNRITDILDQIVAVEEALRVRRKTMLRKGLKVTYNQRILLSTNSLDKVTSFNHHKVGSKKLRMVQIKSIIF